MELLSPNDVCKMLSISRTTLWRKSVGKDRDDNFPKSIEVGKNSVRYIREDIEKWILSRKKEGPL